MLDKPRILYLFPNSLINSIKHEHSCKILYLFNNANTDGKTPGGGGVATLIFSYVGLGHFLGVQNFEIQYFWGGFRKMNSFGGIKILCIYFFGSPQNWTIFRGHFYAFQGLILRSRYRMEDIFGGL